MKINEIKKVQETLTYLDHLGKMSEVSYCTPSQDFYAGMKDCKGVEYKIFGEEVAEVIREHIEKELNKTIEKLAQYGINVEI